MIRTRANTAGFRRAGVAHPSGHWQEWPNDQFSKEQLAELEADPMIQVEIVEGKQADPEGGQASKTAKTPKSK